MQAFQSHIGKEIGSWRNVEKRGPGPRIGPGRRCCAASIWAPSTGLVSHGATGTELGGAEGTGGSGKPRGMSPKEKHVLRGTDPLFLVGSSGAPAKHSPG